MIKNPPEMQETRFDPRIIKIPLRRKWQTTPVYWPEEFHGQKNLAGYRPWGHKEKQLRNFDFLIRQVGQEELELGGFLSLRTHHDLLQHTMSAYI